MSSSEVKELRKNGKLNEALEMAIQDYHQDANNIWNKRSLSWVYYDFLKKHADSKNPIEFFKCLKNIKELDLSSEEKMFFDNLCWPISTLFRQLSKDKERDYNSINEIFNLIISFPFIKPAENFSVLMAAIHKVYKDHYSYVEKIDLLGLDNLMPKDYLEEEFNGRKIMALAEQIYNAYAKQLLEGKPLDAYGHNRKYDIPKIEEFIPKLEQLIVSHPEYVFPPYFLAKLMMRVGGNNVLQTFLPFALKKKNDYWVWQLLAEIHSDKQELVFSCFAKALSLRTKDDFLVKIRQNFTVMLIEKKYFDEARTEIENIVKNKETNEFKIPVQVVGWMNSEWYKSSNAKPNNRSFYLRFTNAAEELLFGNIPEENIIVDYVNEDKKILNFIKNKDKYGFFKYQNLLKSPQVGETYAVRFSNDSNENRFVVHTIKKAESNSSEAVKMVKGNIRIIPSGIGFLDDTFVDTYLIQKNNLQNNDLLQGRAILSYNKKKEEWGWKLINITSVN